MTKVFKLCWKYLRAIALIYLCLFTGDALAALLHIAIPGIIIGMLLLFTLLSLQILPTKWVKPGCQLLIRYMVLLFVPIGVGIMKYYPQIIANLGPLVISCLVSTLLVLVVVGYSAHYFQRQRRIVSKPDEVEEGK
ncbi:CidA/LrgA family protein [Serratia symbiotica]|uniref:CidA/LrgA family protein n=1 Tax=Serratia symbiotica TaxID=138074 RepID=UPI001DD53D4A|nr:CidA/LrgA family protein [Serratia symbiotica]MCX2957391.1 CidA/LrgA family protein [Serratia symbiotica]NIG87207.1 CidA/LrgA family protein [Serratia symbiotica]USS96721.1 CidA/LrgA family protein [Serratia symbiotica]